MNRKQCLALGIVSVSIVIAGFVYADNSRSTMREAPATYETSLPPSPCCGPQPEDLRIYRAVMEGGTPVVIIPEVEGTIGFVITHLRQQSNNLIRFYQDSGSGPEEILCYTSTEPFGVMTGVPLIAGSTITVSGDADIATTIIGYVY